MPEPSIIKIGLGLHLRKINIDRVNNKTGIGLMFCMLVEKPLSPQTVNIKTDNPAEAISATTAGLNPDNIPCMTVNPLNL